MNKSYLKIAICGIPVALGCITACSAISSIKTNDTTQDVVPSNALPYEVYDIDANNVLLGFREGIDLSRYGGICNTMQIPARVTSIADTAFFERDGEAHTTIPSFITNLTFAENSNCSLIGESAFYNAQALASANLFNCTSLTTIDTNAFMDCSSLTSVTLPSSLIKIQEFVFYWCSKLEYIAWDLPNEYETKISIEGLNAFTNISPSGKVESLNPQITSQQLFDWIKDKGNFPSTGWGPAH